MRGWSKKEYPVPTNKLQVPGGIVHAGRAFCQASHFSGQIRMSIRSGARRKSDGWEAIFSEISWTSRLLRDVETPDKAAGPGCPRTSAQLFQWIPEAMRSLLYGYTNEQGALLRASNFLESSPRAAALFFGGARVCEVRLKTYTGNGDC
jgi:hypothetical protein